MFLTTVIPVYNVAAYLRRSVESVLAGGLPEGSHEVVLIDDGSTDGSSELADILAAEHPGVVRAIHKTNGGVGSARNRGIDEARGEWLHFMDSDDWIVPGSYEWIKTHYINGLEPADYVGFHSVTLDCNMRRVWKETLDPSGRVIHEGSGRGCYEAGRFLFFAVCGLFRTSFLRASGVRFDEGMRMAEDTRFMLEFAMSDPRFRLSDSVLYRYEVREGSGVSRRDPGHMRICVENYITLFETIARMSALHPGFVDAASDLIANQMIPFFSRLLSAGFSVAEVRALRDRLEAIGAFPVRARGKYATLINMLMPRPRLCVCVSVFYKNIFVPYVLPRISRN